MEKKSESNSGNQNQIMTMPSEKIIQSIGQKAQAWADFLIAFKVDSKDAELQGSDEI